MPLDNNGILEWWKNGILGIKSGWCPDFYFWTVAPHVKNRSHSAKPSIPTFHYSNTPRHSITAIPPVARLSWPKEPGFRCCKKFCLDNRINKHYGRVMTDRFQVQGSSPPWPPARRAYASESATGCGYEIGFTFYWFGFQSPHLDMPGLGQGFKG